MFRLSPNARPATAALLVFAALYTEAAAQTPAPVDRLATNTVMLEELAQRFEDRLQSRRTQLYYDILGGAFPELKRLHEMPGIDLMYIDDFGDPVFYITNNRDAARTISTDDVWPGGTAGFSLDGTGTSSLELKMWDEGALRLTHVELAGRAFYSDTPTVTSDHSTHVAGTMIAAGARPGAKGMSFQGQLIASSWDNDEAEMAMAALLGARISNHSYGHYCGWYTDDDGDLWWAGRNEHSWREDWKFGFYMDAAAAWDEIAFNAPYYTIVKSAGNDRNDTAPAAGTAHLHTNGLWYTDTHDDDGGATGYDTLPPKATAKNIITVGAVQDLPDGWTAPSGVTITGFSSWGPTDDGRIKPDIVANGQGLLSCGDGADFEYLEKWGTSMSAPNVSGSLNLLLQQYQSLHGGDSPRSATMKALAIHTADEAGPDPGPDYMFGWGLMNTKKAAQIIEADAGALPSGFGKYIFEETLDEGETDTFTFYYSGNEPLKATMAWTDVPGTPPDSMVDPSTRILVNDLNMRLSVMEGPPLPHDHRFPWVMDPADPSAAATKGDNDLDNVEQLYVESHRAGCYQVKITHQGSLTGGSQPYSLILSTPSGCLSLYEPDDPFWLEHTSSLLKNITGGSRGTSWVDVDQDGLLDLFVTSRLGPNRLFRNRGGGIFDYVDLGPLAADDSDHAAAVWGDADNDGDLDVYLLNHLAPNQMFRNDGQFAFVDVTTGSLADPGPGICAAWADYDRDGRLDLYISNRGAPNVLLRNVGDFTFTDQTPSTARLAGATTGVAWGDYDNDGDPDLYVANAAGPNRLLRNDGGGQFTDVTSGPLGDTRASYGVAWGDYDNDRLLDLYVSNDTGPNQLLRNVGGGAFMAVDAQLLQDADGGRDVAWADVDCDGDLDLFLVNVDGANRLFLNDGPPGWSAGDPILADGRSGISAALGDYNGDGMLDIYLGNGPDDEENVLFTNLSGRTNRWVHVALIGTESNRFGIGARIEVITASGHQIREVTAGSGFMGQDSPAAEFGLAAEDVDTLRVLWPSGLLQELTGVPSNQVVTVVESSIASDVDLRVPAPAARGIELLPNRPNPFRPTTTVAFRLHRPGSIKLGVYDPGGRLVKVLADAEFGAGTHHVVWRGRDQDGREAASGMYFLYLQGMAQSRTRKIVLLK